MLAGLSASFLSSFRTNLFRRAHSSLFQTSTRAFSNYVPTDEFIPTDDNYEGTYFDFTEENYARVTQIMSRYPDNYKCAAIIPLLDLAQRQHGGWLPLAAMDKVARIVKTAPIRVYEVASFYTMFNRERVGKYFIQLCGTTPCMVCGSEEIKHTIEQHLGIQEGETTEDGLFTLREVECLGACVNAPMVQINDDCYESLTPESTIQILESCKQGKIVPVGKWGSKPMNGQVSCEGPLGKTSLLEKRPKPGAFMRKDLEAKVDPSSIKQEMGYDKYFEEGRRNTFNQVVQSTGV